MSAGSQKQLLIFWHFFDRLCQQARADNRKVCVINLDDTAANRCANEITRLCDLSQVRTYWETSSQVSKPFRSLFWLPAKPHVPDID